MFLYYALTWELTWWGALPRGDMCTCHVAGHYHVAMCVHATWRRMCAYVRANVGTCERVFVRLCNLWVKHTFQDMS